MTFPALRPSGCVLNPGDFPGNRYTALNGAEVRVRYSAVRISTSIDLTFTNISEAQMLLIYNHYNTNGTFGQFSVPTNIFSGFTTFPALLYPSADVTWRYGDAPSITPVIQGRHTVQVRLISIPRY